MTKPAPMRYPGYDVLRKSNGPSWNDVTRQAIEHRLSLPSQPRFFDDTEWRVLAAVCGRVLPQDGIATPVDLPAQVDDKMASGRMDGYRYPGMPPQGDAWRRGLAGVEEVARRDWGRGFPELSASEQDTILRSMQDGTFEAEALGDMPSKTFFTSRVVADIVNAFYANPAGWNEIGWGGPASPRGYVRMQYDRRDPWEPVEATGSNDESAERSNRNVR